MKVVGDRLRREIEDLQQVIDRLLERFAGRRVVEVADVLRHERLVAARDAGRALEPAAGRNDRRAGAREAYRARRVAPGAANELLAPGGGDAHDAEPSLHAAAPCWLISKEKTFRLAEGANTIGRDPSCAVWLDSPSVSRRHARIVVESPLKRVVLEDLESTNGCLVRGEAVHRPVELSDGDQPVG